MKLSAALVAVLVGAGVAVFGFVPAANAWSYNSSVSVKCSYKDTVVLNGSFTNKEKSSDMKVTMSWDTQSDGPKTVAAGSSVDYTIDTGLTKVSGGKVVFKMTWMDRSGSDQSTVSFGAKDCTPPDVPVTAGTPTFNEGSVVCTPDYQVQWTKPSFTVPAQRAHIEFRLNGANEAIQPGTYKAEFGQTVELEAVADKGYEIEGQHYWKYTFKEKPKAPECQKPPVEVTPADVTFNDDCGLKNDYVSIPSTEGVEYKIVEGAELVQNGKVIAPGRVVVKAFAKEGNVLKGTTEWSHTFTDEPCEVPSTKVTPAPITYTQGSVICTPDNKVKIVNPTVTIPAVKGVTYLEANQNWVPMGIIAADTYSSRTFFGMTKYYVAQAQTGYMLTGQSKWKIVFNSLPEIPDCGPNKPPHTTPPAPPKPPVFHTGVGDTATSINWGVIAGGIAGVFMLLMFGSAAVSFANGFIRGKGSRK